MGKHQSPVEHIVSRWFKTATGLASTVEVAIASKDLLALAASLQEVLNALGVEEVPQEIGYSNHFTGMWQQSVSRQVVNKAINLVTKIRRLEKGVQSSLYREDILFQWGSPVLQSVPAEVRRLEPMLRASKAEPIRIHGFEVVVMPGVTKQKSEGSLKALGEAARIVGAKFPQLIYGKVTLSKTAVNSKHAASYMPLHDSINLTMKAAASIGDVAALCHELGHRYDHRFWKTQSQREQFRILSTEESYETLTFDAPERERISKEYVALVQSGVKPSLKLTETIDQWRKFDLNFDHKVRNISQKVSDLKAGKITAETLRKFFLAQFPETLYTDRVLKAPMHVTPYGGTDWHENFAEAFQLFVLGKPLPADIESIMKALP